MKGKRGHGSVSFAAMVLCMAFLPLACQYAPLTANHGYPAAWPELTALSKGSAEIDGTYANEGIATSAEGGFEPITLASLIPTNRPLAQQDIAPPGTPIREDSVRLVVSPARSQWGLATLRAFIASGDSIQGYEIETGSDENVLLYVLEISSSSLGSVAASSSQVRVFLTTGEDGSLIAQLHSEDFAMALFVPYYSSEYVWARFERTGD